MAGKDLIPATSDVVKIPTANTDMFNINDALKNVSAFFSGPAPYQSQMNSIMNNKKLSATEKSDLGQLDLIQRQMYDLDNPSVGSQIAPWLSAFGTAEGIYSKYFGQGKDQFDEQMAGYKQNREHAAMARADRTNFLSGTKSAFA